MFLAPVEQVVLLRQAELQEAVGPRAGRRATYSASAGTWALPAG
jgi:hypothetical protein